MAQWDRTKPRPLPGLIPLGRLASGTACAQQHLVLYLDDRVLIDQEEFTQASNVQLRVRFWEPTTPRPPLLCGDGQAECEDHLRYAANHQIDAEKNRNSDDGFPRRDQNQNSQDHGQQSGVTRPGESGDCFR
jgi:hypothetical protein